MAITNVNTEDRLVQKTFADHLHDELGWDSIYAFNAETFGPDGTLGRDSARDVVLTRDLRAALEHSNDAVPASAIEQAIEKLTGFDLSHTTLQHNQEQDGYIRNGVPVEWRDERGEQQSRRLKVIDFEDPTNNRFLAVRELKLQGLLVPHYDRRADLVCYLNWLPLVFNELKAVYRNIHAGFDDNLTEYLHQSIPHAFHHNCFLVVSNGDRARYGSITSQWEHFAEWKRNDEKARGQVDAEVLLNGMLTKGRLLDLMRSFVLFDASKAGGVRKIVGRNHQVPGGQQRRRVGLAAGGAEASSSPTGRI